MIPLTENNLARLSQFVYTRSGGGLPDPRGATEAERNAAALQMAVSRAVAGITGARLYARNGNSAETLAAAHERAEVLWALLQSVASTWRDHPDHPEHADEAAHTPADLTDDQPGTDTRPDKRH